MHEVATRRGPICLIAIKGRPSDAKRAKRELQKPEREAKGYIEKKEKTERIKICEYHAKGH